MNRMNRLFWRVHFWAGLVSSPIVLFAAFTGLLYVFTPQIESWRHAGVDHVLVGQALQPLDAQVAAVQAMFPGRALRMVVPAFAPGDTTQVYLRAPHAHQGGRHEHGLPDGSIVYVNPYTAQVVGDMGEMQRFGTWAKKLHSTALQGEGWRWLIELGASWMLVMFATGIAMWWPRPQAAGGPGWRALIPRFGRGRLTWSDLHAVVALGLGIVTAIVLLTGLTWSKHTGENFRQLQDSLAQGSPALPASLRSTPPAGAALSWQAAFDIARAKAPHVSLKMTPPRGIGDTWRIENFDRSQPGRRFLMALDAGSGQVLFHSGWEQLPMLAKATAVGIPFHRAEFGVWNQVLLGLSALATIFSVVSGLVMWWMRRPRGKVGAPSLDRQHLRQVPAWLWLLAAVLAAAMPVFGWSLLVFVGIEALRMGWPRLRQGSAV